MTADFEREFEREREIFVQREREAAQTRADDLVAALEGVWDMTIEGDELVAAKVADGSQAFLGARLRMKPSHCQLVNQVVLSLRHPNGLDVQERVKETIHRLEREGFYDVGWDKDVHVLGVVEWALHIYRINAAFDAAAARSKKAREWVRHLRRMHLNKANKARAAGKGS